MRKIEALNSKPWMRKIVALNVLRVTVVTYANFSHSCHQPLSLFPPGAVVFYHIQYYCLAINVKMLRVLCTEKYASTIGASDYTR